MKSSGFTLVELVIVIIIGSILGIILIQRLTNMGEISRDVTRKTDLAQIVSALELYHFDNGHYPPSRDDPYPYAYHYSSEGPERIPGINGIYINPLPVDPINNHNLDTDGPVGDEGGIYSYVYTDPYRYNATLVQSRGAGNKLHITYQLMAVLENDNDPEICKNRDYNLRLQSNGTLSAFDLCNGFPYIYYTNYGSW